MMQGPGISGLAAWIILWLPFAVLVSAVLYALRARGRRGTRDFTGPEPESPARGRYGTPLAPSTPHGRAAETSAEMKRDGESAPGGAAGAVKRAEVEGRDRDLAGLHLAYARELISAGRRDEAAQELRKSVRVASRTGDAKVHGEGRLELAEMAREDGDLTTACEHWQIARRLFSDLGLTAELKKPDTLMRQHGCPTDWVLNDF